MDYCRLNAVTKWDAYPQPRMDGSLDDLTGSVYFNMLDFLSRYLQVPFSKDAQEKAALLTRGSLWTCKVLPFALTSVPVTF